jgi:hypothetical protein
MKAFLFMSAALLGIAATSTLASAQNYPWCGYYGGGGDNGTNCGFTTYAQCMTTVIGGYCARNTQYVPPPGPRTRAQRRSWYNRLNR